MTPEITINTITCIAFFLLAFISIFNPAKVNIIANRWLGLFCASVGCMLFNVVLNNARLDLTYPRLIGFNELSRFAMGPALYLAIVQFTTPGSKFSAKKYLHFIPFAIFFVYMIPLLYFPGYQSTGGHFTLSPRLNFIMANCVRWSINLQLLLYWIFAFDRLRQHQKHIQLIASNTLPVSLNWLSYLLLSVGGMLLLFFITIFFQILVPAVYISCGYLAGALVILYYALAQKEIYPFKVAELKAINQVIADAGHPIKTINQRFDEDLARQLQIKLERLMAKEKLYLDNELSLPQLAQNMAISVHDLSFLLNEKIGLNFFQFVNSYRVEEAKKLMLSDQYKHFSLLGIAYSAGFSAKTTFNTAFKNQTGVSPSQYIKQNKVVAASASLQS